MTQENKDALYREEFIVIANEKEISPINEIYRELYLAGRRKGQEEIEILKFERVPVEIHNDEIASWKMSVDRLVTVNGIKDGEIIELKKEIESSSRLAQIQSSKLHWAIGLFTDEQHEWFKGMLKTQGLSFDPPIDHVDKLNKEIKSLKKELDHCKAYYSKDNKIGPLAQFEYIVEQNIGLKKEIEELRRANGRK